MRILVLGATGMLGNTLFRYLADFQSLMVFGSVRHAAIPASLPKLGANQVVIANVNATSDRSLEAAFARAKPDVVVNCIGVIKQLSEGDDPLVSIPINSLLPHRVARFAKNYDARVIHISTDCVFSGKKGHYVESDVCDATDLYGRSKLLGELYAPGTVTLRTSIIGHELATKHGLLEWFLSQPDKVEGYVRAVFSGLPTVELARVIHEFVLPNSELSGLYHVAADPISKLDLLRLIAEVYRAPTKIVPSERVVIDRSLDGARFNAASNYSPPTWRKLVEDMHKFH